MAALTASAGGLAGSLPGIAALTITLVIAGVAYGWLVESAHMREGFGPGILFWSAALPVARSCSGDIGGGRVPRRRGCIRDLPGACGRGIWAGLPAASPSDIDVARQCRFEGKDGVARRKLDAQAQVSKLVWGETAGRLGSAIVCGRNRLHRRGAVATRTQCVRFRVCRRIELGGKPTL